MATVDGFPIGTRVRVNERGRGNYSRQMVSQMGDGVVIDDPSESTDLVHVNWGEGFIGHRAVDVGHNGHCYFMGATELDIIAMPPQTLVEPTIPSEIPRLRVTIARNPSNYNYWGMRVENGPSNLGKMEIKECMDKKEARRLGRVWNTYDINGIIHRGIDMYGINPEVFIAAITQAALARQAREATGTFTRQVYDSELQVAMGSQPALIAIGDQLFSLQPRGVVKASRAMAVIKERVVKAARDQAVRIKASAQVEAQTIIRNGERQLEIARKQIELEKAAITNVLTLPLWVSENYLKVRRWDSPTHRMAVGIEVNTKIDAWQTIHSKNDEDGGVETETVKWSNTTDHPYTIPILYTYHTVTVWLPFNPDTGSYSYKSCKVIEGTIREDGYPYSLPHIGYERCCMDLQGLPKVMSNFAEYKQIAAAINRGNREVNLMSLLHGFNYWHPDIQNQCPKTVKKMIDEERHHTLVNRPDSDFIGADRVAVRVEARETFNVDSLRAAREARGESLPDI